MKAVVDAPAPRDVSELKSFLGMVNYYGKFLPDLATLLSPLYTLLQRTTVWKWGEPQREAFQKVKDLLKSGRVLVHFNDQLPLVLSCDASLYGLGAVLAHCMPDGTERPVGFASRTLAKAEQNYSQLDKEALAIIFGVKKYHQYLYGRHFEIKTDHKPLTRIFSEAHGVPPMASGRLWRWALTLGAYDYSIQYREGSKNSNADALSRLPLPATVNRVPVPAEVVHLMEHLNSSILSSSQIRTWTGRDPTLSRVKSWLRSGWPSEKLAVSFQPFVRRRDELSVEEGCVLWGHRVVVPEKGWSRVLDVLHEVHPGIGRMKSFSRGYVWWPGIDEQIENCVKECNECQLSRKSPPPVPMHPWSWPDRPWSRIHVDYAGPFEGKMFLLIMDVHSKWLEVHMTDSSTSTATIELLRKTFACLGLPDVVVSDNATTFTSNEFGEFLKQNGVRHVRTPPYHPASNGLVERAVQTFKDGMKRLTNGSLNTRLQRFLFKYRITPHSTTGTSPAELMFGRKLRSHLDQMHPDLRGKVRQNQDRQKEAHDNRARVQDFVIGDLVYARNYGQGPRWLLGQVVEIAGSVVYTIQLEDGWRVKRHAEQLRKRQGKQQLSNSTELEASPVESTDPLEDVAASSQEPPGTPSSDDGSAMESDLPQGTESPLSSPPPDLESETLPSTDSMTEPRAAASSEEVTQPALRRSTRERRLPDRFGH